MACSVCGNSGAATRPLLCPTCVRAEVYPIRVEQVKARVERETLGKQVELVVRHKPTDIKATCRLSPAALVAIAEGAKKNRYEQNKAGKIEIEERIVLTAGFADKLRSELKGMREDIQRRKRSLARRRDELRSAASKEVEDRRSEALSMVQKSIARIQSKREQLHGRIVDSRAFLCREVADLLGLRQRRRKAKDGSVKEDYMVGRLIVPDLRDLNRKFRSFSVQTCLLTCSPVVSPGRISASLGNLAHLVILCSHYLHLRLPAEITLPHRNWPLTTIFTPTASYSGRDVTFPGHTRKEDGPEASRHLDQRPLPRPRPLYVDRRLGALYRENPSAFSLFIEGLALLAWDVAWLCRTQGMSTGLQTPEDVCSMTKNLYQLFSDQPTPPPSPGPRSQTPSKETLPAHTGTRDRLNPSTQHNYSLGVLSHGTSYAFLASSEGLNYLRRSPLPSHTEIADWLKSHLLAEMSGADWELLDQKEWDEEAHESREEPVLVGGSSTRAGEDSDGRSTTTLRSVTEVSQAEGREGAEKVKGTSGWTKLKSRTEQ